MIDLRKSHASSRVLKFFLYVCRILILFLYSHIEHSISSKNIYMPMMKSIKDRFEVFGLVDVLSLDHSIKCDIRYATTNNFTGSVLYGEDMGVYCVPRLAEAVVATNRLLKDIDKNLSIIIFDAARPLSVQKVMFEIVKGTSQEPYIANPYKNGGGFHNYALAVDLSICDSNMNLLNMGTEYDSFQEIAHTGNEDELLSLGKISLEAYNNRRLLYDITSRSGLTPHPNEWWHYQLSYDDADKQRYNLLNF